MIHATLTGAQAIERALKIIAGNTANAPTTMRQAVAHGETPLMKRSACATNECVSCPYSRDSGSC